MLMHLCHAKVVGDRYCFPCNCSLLSKQAFQSQTEGQIYQYQTKCKTFHAQKLCMQLMIVLMNQVAQHTQYCRVQQHHFQSFLSLCWSWTGNISLVAIQVTQDCRKAPLWFQMKFQWHKCIFLQQSEHICDVLKNLYSIQCKVLKKSTGSNQ